MTSTKQNMSQGLQSCLEPLMLKSCVLTHNLVPSKQEQSENHCSEIGKNCESNKNGWNLIDALTKTSHIFKQIDDNSKQVYVKRSSSSMSTRSLEMCTESLGNETGSDVFLSMGEFSHIVSDEENYSTIKQSKSQLFSKKVKRSDDFPPPLTSISASNGVQMQLQAHREEGRLVINAFSSSSCRRSFEVVRGNGRLTLYLIKNDDGDNGEEFEVESDKEGDFNGGLRGERVGCRIRGGEWGKSRCNGEGRLPSLRFCVAIS